MEAGFLNFHDEEHFSDFSLSLDHQHNLLGESQSSLGHMVDNDFDYVESLGFDSNDAELWEKEQELNGDLAVLPVSGVSGVIPKMENMKEDFAKVLTDWQEHIGFLQATEIEEDINLDMGLQMNGDLVDDIYDNLPKPDDAETNNNPKDDIYTNSIQEDDSSEDDSLDDPQSNIIQENNVPYISVKLEKPIKRENISYLNQVQFETDHNYENNRVSESDQSQEEIDVVGLDSIEDVNPITDFIHVRRQHMTPSKEYNSKILGKNITKLKQEPDFILKEESIEFADEIPPPDSPSNIKSSKKKRSKRQKEEIPNKKSRKASKEDTEVVTKVSKKSKKDSKSQEFTQEARSSNVLLSKKSPVLEAGDVTSLLEQFEASEAAAVSSQIPKTAQSSQVSSKKTSPKFSVNKSQVTLLKKSVDSQEFKLHQDIRDSLPKEVIDRIKASGRKKVISLIPAKPHTKAGLKNNGTRMQEAAATLSRNKLLKLVSNNNSNGRVDGSVHLDHDYCSNSNSILSSSSNSSSSDSISEYDRQNSDSEQHISNKDESCKQKYDCYDKGGTAEHTKPTSHKGSAMVKKNSCSNWSDTSSKKDSGLESGDVSDASEEQQPAAKVKKSSVQDQTKKELKEIQKIPIQAVTKINNNKPTSLLNKTTPPSKPAYEMKIQSALATSILQLRKGVLTKTKSLETQHKPMQMVSVLKKPPIATTPQKILGSNLKESIVTTTNSSNDQVQNIIVQEATDVELPEETAKKPPRRKLNLAEYRSRREQNRSDGSRTNSPIQPMALVYIHHASTNTEPFNDDPENPIWSEREIVSVLKPKSEIEEDKIKPKRPTRDRGMQTYETVFGICYEEPEEETEKEEEEKEQEKEEEKEKVEEKEKEKLEEQEKEKLEEKEQRQEIESQNKIKQPQEEQMQKSVQIETVKDNTAIVQEDVMEEGEVESGEVVDDEQVTNNEVTEKILESEKVVNEASTNSEMKEIKTNSLNRGRDRKHRNYRRTRVSSASSNSRSRSRSRNGRTVRRASSRNRDRSRSRSPVKSNRSRQRTRDNRTRSRSRSRSSSSDVSRSRSRSRSRTRCNTRRRKISHRRSSVSSSSSWSSRSRSHSRSRSRYRSRSSSRSRSRNSRSRSRSSRYSSCSRSPYRRPYDDWYMKEKQRQVEERRVIYVGRLKEGITKAELRRRFEVFGPVVDISVHFRERGHNYGFVTFAYKNDAYEAVEHGNDDPSLPRYDLCFGGRRAFCKVKYADLDGAATNSLGGSSSSNSSSSNRTMYKPEEENTFDLLLKEAQAKLRKRKV